MEFLSNKPLLITDTILRDAHQSQAATRMTTEDMLPALEMLDSIGYYSLECWGGATFDACMRFLNEDPWERLRTIRQHVKHTKLQMLFRGQNILGYKHYADDVVDAFCAKSIENGIDIIRIFDALNDVRNLEQAIKSTRKYGGEVEATMSYTVSPIHNEDYFVKLAKTLEDMGASAICVKDMANLLLPMDAYSLIKRLKETVSIPIHLHTHNTTGTGDMVNLMAAMAGVDIVDTALSPLANGTSQPATESLVATLRGTVRDTGLDQSKLSEAAAHFRKVAALLQNEGILDPTVLRVDTNTLLYQVPGGMLSNLIRRHFSTFSFHGTLSGAQGKTLHFILARGQECDVFQKDIEEEYSLRPPTATKLLKDMEKNGLIYREAVPYDARLKRIVATEKAMQYQELIHQSLEETEDRLTSGISSQDLAVFFRVINQMIRNMS